MNNLLGHVINYYRPGELYSVEETKQVRCFFHGPDNTLSARYYAETDSYNCFACGAFATDAAWFVARFEEIPYSEAQEFIETKFKVRLPKKEQDQHTLKVYERLITDMIIQSRYKDYNKAYYQLDKALREKNVERMKYLFDGFKNRTKTTNS